MNRSRMEWVRVVGGAAVVIAGFHALGVAPNDDGPNLTVAAIEAGFGAATLAGCAIWQRLPMRRTLDRPDVGDGYRPAVRPLPPPQGAPPVADDPEA